MNGTRVINGVEFVEKDYELDPKTEQILNNGRLLRDGMIILLARPWYRANLNDIESDSGEFSVAMWNNRWMTISDVRLDGASVYFTATYRDGSVTRKHHMTKLPWIVKKETIVSEPTDENPSHLRVPKDWYHIAQEALKAAFEGFVAVGEDQEPGVVRAHMKSERIAQLAAKIAVDAILPHVHDVQENLTNDQGDIDTPADMGSYEFVPKYYHMDPATDDVVPSGYGLKAGMRVLIENDRRRIDINQPIGPMSDGELSELFKWNRWATVAVRPSQVAGGQISVILEYDDGTKRQIIEEAHYAWFVKKYSLPQESDAETNFVQYKNEAGEIERMSLENFMDLFREANEGPPNEKPRLNIFTERLVSNDHDDDGSRRPDLGDLPAWAESLKAMWDQSGDPSMTNYWRSTGKDNE